MMIAIVAVAMPLVLVPVIMILRYVLGRQERQHQHEERLRAMELGRPLPGSNAGPALTCIAIGALVPIGAFFCVWMVSLRGDVDVMAWIAAMIVSIVAVVSSLRLASTLFEGGSQPEPTPSDRLVGEPRINNKPSFDPDSIDVVGRRG